MGKDTFAAVILLIVGAFSIISSLFNWNFFFENRKAYFFVKIFGRTGARIFYGLLGLFLSYAGLMLLDVF